ncbi:TP901-1 family phage major tail protein [Rhodoligotrophos appendicifer]|uniref:phage major tail protein, TP901-1 family n=1 Tax=Rhodoligotrophos appendicifer TaxID=987056 RepID=UPI001185F41F|nr:phage major tail protein, TP901-1 family [Rhodoligotrophos appendicifer]
MAAQKGRDLLLKVDSTGSGVFVTIAGLRTHSLGLNARTVDVTHAESAGQWRELLSGAGVRTASVRGAGIFKDEASDATVRSYFFADTIRDWQVVVPDFGTIEGAFQITALDYAGPHDGEMSFELALESAGALTFTAA